MISIIKLVGFVVICLLAYIIIYDHCVNKVPLASSFTKLVRKIFTSSIIYIILIISVVGGIFWVIYALMHNGSLF